MRKIFVSLVSIALLVGFLSGCIETEETETKNKLPKAIFSVPINTDVNSEIEFTDSSTDKDGTISEWYWDFGDGTNSTDQNPTHTYSLNGTYTVKLTITDNEGAEDTEEIDLLITLMDIVETAAYSGFDTLANALTAANLVTTLQGEGPFTVFAPTNESFAALNQTWLTNLINNITNLTKVLTYHVLLAEVIAADITDGLEALTVEGTNITFAIDGSNVTINNVANITQTDIECSNGYIHVIDAVLVPESVEGP